MNSEIIYVCNSVNNKNVREGELEILRKYEDQKYFEFGENEMNIKKRYYKDLESLNKDFDALLKLKNKEEKEEVKEEVEEVADEEFRNMPIFKEDKKIDKKVKRRNSLF